MLLDLLLFLSGGDSFKKVLKSPISFSFNERLLIETPHVNLTIIFSIFNYFNRLAEES